VRVCDKTSLALGRLSTSHASLRIGFHVRSTVHRVLCPPAIVSADATGIDWMNIIHSLTEAVCRRGVFMGARRGSAWGPGERGVRSRTDWRPLLYLVR
jgi:hypothetical protein